MAHLQIKRGDVVTRAELSARPATIGRQDDNTIVVNEPQMSRRHCVIEKNRGGYRLSDLGSRNGTIINGKLTQQHVLAKDDLIRVGATEIRFVDDAPAKDAKKRRRFSLTARHQQWVAMSFCAVVAVMIAVWVIGLFRPEHVDSLVPNSVQTSPLPSALPLATPRILPVQGEEDEPRVDYVLMTAENLKSFATAHLNKPVRGKFVGVPIAAADGSLHWELPPGGELIAVIDPGSEVHAALTTETKLLEAELYGILQSGGEGKPLVLRVSEVRIMHAWGSSDSELAQATQELLGKRIVVNPQFTAEAASDLPE